ncbi:MAG: ribonuclease P protein component [bacterium]
MPSGRAGFSRQQRIIDAGHYRAVFDNRLRVHGRFFSLHVMANGLDRSRLGLAVSRKVSKKAVQRNRIKRQVRESFRCLQWRSKYQASNGEPAAVALDIVVVAKATAVNGQNTELRQELDQLWMKAIKKCEAS